MMATCLLCHSEAERVAIGLDLFRYDCAIDRPFEIAGSHEAVLRKSATKTTQARKWVARQRRNHPTAIPRIET